MSGTAKKIRHASYIMMGSIVLSRVLGFAKEIAIAHTIGANENSDVYFASFTIPDILNHLMASQALSISFVPLLSIYLEKKQPEQAKKVFQTILGVMGAVCLGLVIVGEFAAPWLSRWIAPGFNDPQHELLTELLRIILPAQFFFYYGGLGIALQYAHGHFWLPAFAPLIYNVGIISLGLLLHPWLGVKSFSVGVLIGCFFSHGVLQSWGVRRLNYSLVPQFSLDDETKQAIKKYLWLTLPIIATVSLVFADELLMKYFASHMESGSVSWLNYGRRVMFAPVGFIATAAGIASFPFLSRYWQSKDFEKYANTLTTDIKKLWAATTLFAIFIAIFAKPIVYLLFYWPPGGRFSLTDLDNTAIALQIFCIGIFAWAVQTILSRGFYAAQNTWLPAVLGTVVTVLFFPLYHYFGFLWGFKGVALAGSLGVTTYCFSLAFLLRRHVSKVAPEHSFSSLYQFCSLWALVAAIAAATGWGIQSLGLFQESKLTAVIELTLAALAMFGPGIFLIRGYLKRFTGGEPLF